MCQVNTLVQIQCLFNLAAATGADMWDKNYKPVDCQRCAHSNRFYVFFLFTHDVVFTGFVFSGVDGFSVDVATTMDIRDQNNKELSMRLVTNIQSGDVFYTDLNGFQV